MANLCSLTAVAVKWETHTSLGTLGSHDLSSVTGIYWRQNPGMMPNVLQTIEQLPESKRPLIMSVTEARRNPGSLQHLYDYIFYFFREGVLLLAQHTLPVFLL